MLPRLLLGESLGGTQKVASIIMLLFFHRSLKLLFKQKIIPYFSHSLFLFSLLNIYVPFWLNLCIQVGSIFSFFVFFVFAFTQFRHVNQNSLIERTGSMIVLCHINTVRCLVPPEASKNSLTSKCNSSHYFELLKATDLRLMWNLE